MGSKDRIFEKLFNKQDWFIVCKNEKILSDVSRVLAENGIFKAKTMNEFLSGLTFQYHYMVPDAFPTDPFPGESIYCVVSDNPYLETDILTFITRARSISAEELLGDI